MDDKEDWNPRTIFKNNEFIIKISDGTIPIKRVFEINISKDLKYIEYTNTLGQYTGEIYLGYISYYWKHASVLCSRLFSR